jgi:hypothetical protein
MEEHMDKFDEYKFFVDGAQQLSKRRQSTTGTYLTVNTAILTVLAFLVKDTGLQGWKLVLAILPLFLVGILACAIWQKIIIQYKSLIGWRYEQLMEIEKAVPKCHQMYLKEWECFYKPKKEKKSFGFSHLEAWLPRLFLGLYAIYGVGLVVATAFGLW